MPEQTNDERAIESLQERITELEEALCASEERVGRLENEVQVVREDAEKVSPTEEENR